MAPLDRAQQHHEDDDMTSTQDHSVVSIQQLLDKQADMDGLSNVSTDKDDWTDVKHSERKKRDRMLDDGVLIALMRKSDFKGFQRLFLNLGILGMTCYIIQCLEVFPYLCQSNNSNTNNNNKEITLATLALFLPIYFFYGFQIQCFAFAGQHEFLHRNAFATKWINDVCLFLIGTVCFELGEHERVMHKQHHTFTNNIDRDPELTSFHSREVLEHPEFRNAPESRFAYFMGFFDIIGTFKCRVGKIVFSALGIPVDYSGTGWSLKDFNYTKESGIMRKLQLTAIAQIVIYILVGCTCARSIEGIQRLLFWWFIPVLIGYPSVNYFRNLEHADCEVSKESNCLRNTRTVESNLIIRTLLWDTNFHVEHHCYPMVPFYNLHIINKLMHEHVIHNECTHFTTQNWEAVRPGGWIDQQTQRMKNNDVVLEKTKNA